MKDYTNLKKELKNMTKDEVLEKVMDMAFQLTQKFDYDLDDEMQDLVMIWNLEHMDDEHEQICMALDEEDADKFYVEWNSFHYAR